MSRKFLLLSLISLCIILLMPVTSLADSPNNSPAKHFKLVFTPKSIDDTVIGNTWPQRVTAATNVWPILDIAPDNPAPSITGWIVDGRSIFGDVAGDIKGGFTFTYGGVLDVMQSGSIQGVATIKSGAMDVIYLSTRGDIDAQVKNYYTFDGIKAWCTTIGITPGLFFSQIYNTPSLAGLPDELLKAMYQSGQLPPLPMTLTAVFQGTVKIETGAGSFGGVRGSGEFGPLDKKALILSIYPNQHVYKLDGALKVTGTYIKQQPRSLGHLDKEQLRSTIDKFFNKLNK